MHLHYRVTKVCRLLKLQVSNSLCITPNFDQMHSSSFPSSTSCFGLLLQLCRFVCPLNVLIIIMFMYYWSFQTFAIAMAFGFERYRQFDYESHATVSSLTNSYDANGHGIWCALFYMMTALLGYSASYKPTKKL